MDNSSFLKSIEKAIPVGERTTSSDFSLTSNSSNLFEITRIAFLDSRGKKISPDLDPDFLAAQLANHWRHKNEKYLVLTRTHASTTIFTLLNFLDNLKIQIPYLITNIGFVDFTPKKKSVVEDIVLQAKQLFSHDQFFLVDLGKYKLSSGETEELVALDLHANVELFKGFLEKYCQKVVLIGTHQIDHQVRFERERPASFYSQLGETNKFLKALSKETSKIKFVSPPDIEGAIQSSIFDGVHFTKRGHDSLFDKLRTENLI